MKCQNCDGNGRFEVEDNGVVMQGVYWRCPTCDGKGIVEPLTNEEYIRSCSTEELAKLIYKIAVTDVLMDRFFTAEMVNAGIVDVDSGIKEAGVWLKEKHEPLKNDEK